PAPQQPRSNEGARSLQASDDRSAELALQQRADRSAEAFALQQRADRSAEALTLQQRDGRSAEAVTLQVTTKGGERSGKAFALQTKGLLAITNARIFPVARPPIERGSIVIRDGIIENVGANVSVPPGAHVIDAAGADVYPGFIDARSTIGLADPGAGGFDDANEVLDFNPQLRAQVAFHNDSDAIPVLRANGITTVAVTPGGGLLGGQIAVMDLDGYTWEESTVASSIGVSFQFPRLGGGGGGAAGLPQDRSYDDVKKERDARLDRVVRLLADARAYAKA